MANVAELFPFWTPKPILESRFSVLDE